MLEIIICHKSFFLFSIYNEYNSQSQDCGSHDARRLAATAQPFAKKKEPHTNSVTTFFHLQLHSDS